MWSDFKAFLLKTNAIALAIAIIIGVALGSVVNSLVKDIIMPPVGLALGGVDFSALRIVLQDNADPAKVVAINYGMFLNTVISFVVIAFVVYWISKALIREEPAVPPAPSKACPYCKEANAVDATKCRACTSAI